MREETINKKIEPTFDLRQAVLQHGDWRKLVPLSTMHLCVEAHGAGCQQAIPNVQLLVAGGALGEQGGSPGASAQQDLVGVQDAAVKEAHSDARVGAVRPKDQRAHLAKDVLDAAVDCGLDNGSQGLVGLGEAHAGVPENAVEALEVGCGEDAVPAFADLVNGQKLGVVGDAHVAIGGHALLTKVGGISAQHAHLVIPGAVERVAAPHGHRPGEHAHVQLVWIIIAHNLVDVVRRRTRVREGRRVDEGDLEATHLAECESRGSTKVAGPDNEDGRERVDGHDCRMSSDQVELRSDFLCVLIQYVEL